MNLITHTLMCPITQNLGPPIHSVVSDNQLECAGYHEISTLCLTIYSNLCALVSYLVQTQSHITWPFHYGQWRCPSIRGQILLSHGKGFRIRILLCFKLKAKNRIDPSIWKATSNSQACKKNLFVIFSFFRGDWQMLSWIFHFEGQGCELHLLTAGDNQQ
jgi:hypothetical protein